MNARGTVHILAKMEKGNLKNTPIFRVRLLFLVKTAFHTYQWVMLRKHTLYEKVFA